MHLTLISYDDDDDDDDDDDVIKQFFFLFVRVNISLINWKI